MRFYRSGPVSLYGLFIFNELKRVESAALGLKRLAGLIAQGKLTPRISVEDSWENRLLKNRPNPPRGNSNHQHSG